MRTEFANRVAVVTGASSGIGRAIARAIAERGATLCLVGRRPDALEAVRREVSAAGPSSEVYVCDLAQAQDIYELRDRLASVHGRVDILVHSAGTISLGTIEAAPIADFDQQFQINVRAPYLLTQSLLPLVKTAQGQIVFINSSVGVHTKEQVGAYAASKHALRAIADTLRMENNAHGVRVLSVFPGNTATSMQEVVQDYTGRRIASEYLLQPDDVASMVIHALQLPRTAEVTDIHIRPFRKSSA
jgi:NADP-dependent 3-hydroxy acid dehydrogenase YdfG